jgi:hypothetical protein
VKHALAEVTSPRGGACPGEGRTKNNYNYKYFVFVVKLKTKALLREE